MKTKTIKLNEIVIDAGTQQRVTINNDVVAEYAEAMRCGTKFPAITVFFNGSSYYLVDGYHRYNATKDAGIDDILADVIDGTKREAVLYSLGVNNSHGIRLTNSDKRKAVLTMLEDDEWCHWTDTQISKHCKVTQQFVSKIRREINDTQKDIISENIKTVVISPLEPAQNLETENSDHEEFDPKEHELQEAHDTINNLAEENNKLRDSLAAGQLPEDEIVSAEQTMIDLRKQVKNLEAELDAVKSSRDIYQRENEELKKQCKMYENKLKKLSSGNAKS